MTSPLSHKNRFASTNKYCLKTRWFTMKMSSIRTKVNSLLKMKDAVIMISGSPKRNQLTRGVLITRTSRVAADTVAVRGMLALRLNRAGVKTAWRRGVRQMGLQRMQVINGQVILKLKVSRSLQVRGVHVASITTLDTKSCINWKCVKVKEPAKLQTFIQNSSYRLWLQAISQTRAS